LQSHVGYLLRLLRLLLQLLQVVVAVLTTARLPLLEAYKDTWCIDGVFD